MKSLADALPPEIAPLLAQLVRRPAHPHGDAHMIDPLDKMPEVVSRDMADQESGSRRGQLSTFTCPECGGAMWQVDDSDLTRFRCHVGHAYYGEALLAEQSEALEAALWTAVRTFKEKTVLARQLAQRERERRNAATAARFEEEAQLAEKYGGLVHEHLLKIVGGLSGKPAAGAPQAARE